MIIDFHTHPVLDAEDNLNFYDDKTISDTNIYLKDMKDSGIDIFCGSVIGAPTEDFDKIFEYNQKARKLKKIYKDAYIPGIHVLPQNVKRSILEIEAAAKDGISLIGELVPYMHGWEDYSCSAFSEVLDAAAQHKMVVSLHTIDLDSQEKMAREHKDITFVFAHPGERAMVEKHIEVMKKCDNVYLDTSGTGLFRYGLLRYLVNKVGSDRILFGTDYPICNPRMYVQAVLGEHISDGDKEKILGDNAKRLLRIE